jgi:hypothetical protein
MAIIATTPLSSSRRKDAHFGSVRQTGSKAPEAAFLANSTSTTVSAVGSALHNSDSKELSAKDSGEER